MTEDKRVESPPEDLPRETIIIVGCVCGFIVLVLLVVLIVLCCRRHQAKKEDYVQHQQRATVPSTSAPPVGEKRPNGLDNPAMDMVDMEEQRRAFTSNGGKPYGLNGSIPHETAPPAYKDLDRKYSNSREPEYTSYKNHKHNVLTLDSPDAFTPDQENSDSGVSTPDVPVKPKKVIYEVIV